MSTVQFTLSYTGGSSDDHRIDLYDVGQALIGFQRSLALTTHLVLNDEVITQSPALRGAKILAQPSEAGSWKITAAVLVGIYTVGTAPKDTPIGHLISSAYDYVVSETLGFHVDYEKTLGQQYEEIKSLRNQIKPLAQARFDSVAEKCENAIRDMHRPIVASETALTAHITAEIGEQKRPFERPLNRNTFEYVAFTETSTGETALVGQVSSYNINTFRGRIYVQGEGRPIPFELADSARDYHGIRIVTESLTANANERMKGSGNIRFTAFRNTSRSGQLKSYYIIEVLPMATT